MRTLVLVLTLATASRLFAQPSGPYRITHSYTLGGDGGWDYIVPDPANHRLFIGRQDRVMVVDGDTGTLLGQVTGIQGAHGTAIENRHAERATAAAIPVAAARTYSRGFRRASGAPAVARVESGSAGSSPRAERRVSRQASSSLA